MSAAVSNKMKLTLISYLILVDDCQYHKLMFSIFGEKAGKKGKNYFCALHYGDRTHPKLLGAEEMKIKPPH